MTAVAGQQVNILGAGLCGSLLAVMLARRGFRVTVRESRPDPRRTTQAAGRSINLALAARGMRGLAHAGVLDEVRRILLPMRGRRIHAADGSCELLPYGQRDHEVIYSVSRAALNRLLIDVAETEHDVEILFGHAVKGYDVASGEVLIASNDGDYSLRASGLIAADGAGSRVRRAYDSGGIIEPAESLLEHSYKELSIPPAGNGEFQLDNDALHIWPRGEFMLIALPNPGGDFTLTLFMPNDVFERLSSAQAVREFFSRHFADVVPLIPDLADSYLANPTGILGTVRCAHWHDGDRFLLIGDAAHAIVPFHGQGMNLAFEDCVLLDGLIGKSGVADWGRLFADFEAAQLPNANAIADMALENYVEMRDTVRSPAFALQKSLAFELERRMPRRFIPRYSMVMFHDDIPYAVAQERGRKQSALLQELTAGARSLDDVDLDWAEARVRERLPPLDAIA